MAKIKRNNTRAARRGASPSLDLDKSLTSLPRAESPTTHRPSLLAERASSGIQKKRKDKKMSRAQRLRQQKGMDRAEAVLDQLEIKKAKSFDRAKNIKARSADWNDMNRKSSTFAALQPDEPDDDGDDDAMTTEKTEPSNPSANPFVASEQATADPAPVDEDDEIL
ncbi:hypothetical protein N7462_004411 [Penicillium macrosclerotiorum]|uniref:uncharacterized protein n=1 Tax=Penicillium macrosclerotiorum TaxID=303699 RepID=UPI0025491E89|nr:uncharacterized protein N7462_004411 [Penicillium macrosclerotiorum]KAJ5690019.1 hypothetical protein N7462_004411 [Penicillium macrosclerotiorum]